MTSILASVGLLVVGAAISVLLGAWPRAALFGAMTAIAAAAMLLLSAMVPLLVQPQGAERVTFEWPMPLGVARLAVDGLAVWFLASIAVLSLAVAIYSWAYMRAVGPVCRTGPGPDKATWYSRSRPAGGTYQPVHGEGTRHGSVPAFGALLCLLIASLILVVIAADIPLFLVGWECMTLAAFFLVAFRHRQDDHLPCEGGGGGGVSKPAHSPPIKHPSNPPFSGGASRAAWMYLIATHLGTALCLLPMFALLAARAGTTDFSAFHAALQGSEPGIGTLLFLLGLVGFGTKAGFMPMHIWLPVAHPAAPTPVSALLSGVVIKTGIYGLLRLLSWLPALPVKCGVLMLLFGMVSGVLGVLYALAQHDIKRLLAYHSVENIGIIGLGIGMGMIGQTTGQPALVALGYGGALLHVLNHALFKGLLFLSGGAAIHSTGTGDIERLGGLARATPVNAWLFLIAAISICGLPPFNGFVSEWVLYGSLFGGTFGPAGPAAGMAALGAVSLAIMGGLALACFAKVFSVVFLGEPRDPSIRPRPTPVLMRLSMSLLAVPCVGIGLLPGVFVPLLRGGVSAVAHTPAVEFEAAVQSVLAPAVRLSGLGVVLLVLVAALAVIRSAILRRNMPVSVRKSRVATWGCGYAFPAARMQYTASSFASSLIQSFRHVLWPYREVNRPLGAFPAKAHVESHIPDMAEHDLFAPLFRGVDRVFRMIRTVSWTGQAVREPPRVDYGVRVSPVRAMVTGLVTALRRGSIHVQLAFVVLTLLIVFALAGVSK